MEQKQQEINLKEASSEQLGLILIEKMGFLNQAKNVISEVQHDVLVIECELRGRIPQTTLTPPVQENNNDGT
jgi:hypothetical protein